MVFVNVLDSFENINFEVAKDNENKLYIYLSKDMTLHVVPCDTLSIKVEKLCVCDVLSFKVSLSSKRFQKWALTRDYTKGKKINHSSLFSSFEEVVKRCT